MLKNTQTEANNIQKEFLGKGKNLESRSVRAWNSTWEQAYKERTP